MFESLEPRRLLVLPISGTVIDLDDTPDVAFITTGNDVLEIILSGGNIQVRNGAGTVLDQRSAAGVTGININTQAGNDFVRLGRADGTLMPNVPVTIRGGAGNDTLIGGNNADQIFGDGDNDRLDGRAGGDLLDGGAGFDTADYNYRANRVNATLVNNASGNDGTNTGNNSSPAQYNDNGADNARDIEAVLGGSAGDSLVGNASANWLDGGGGNDTILGGDGIDTITGGVNTDLAYGENDADFFFFQDALGDQFLGGPGTTTAQFDAALDTPAPALPAAAAAFSESRFRSFLAEEDSGILELDDLFGEDENGKVLMSIGGILAQVNDIAIQRVEVAPDEFEERFIVVGSALGPSESYDFLVARYNSDGTLDETFGEDGTGIVYTDMSLEGFSDDIASSVAINEDGQIIVAGTAYKQTFIDDEPVDYSSFAIAKYDADGVLDTNFGDGGISQYEPDGAISQDVAARVEIQYIFNGDTTEEDYVIAGTIGPAIEFFDAEAESTSDFGILRVFNNGSVDFDFGAGGLVTVDYFGNNDFGTGLAIDTSEDINNIWISGYTSNQFTTNFLVAGFDVDGNPIPGALTNYDFGAHDFAYDSVISGSRLLVVGQTGFDGFGSGAILAVNIAPSQFPYPGQVVGSNYVFEDGSVALRGVTLDNDGNAVAVGSLDGGEFYIHRFDPTFLSQIGETTTVSFDDGPEATATAYGAVVQEDGKIVVAGLFDDPFIALARLQDFVEPPPEPSFVDVPLSPQDVQNFGFFVNNDGVTPVPNYLVDRLKALKPDGTVEHFGTNNADTICVTQSGGVLTVTVNGEVFQYPLALMTKVIIRGLDGNDYICVDCSVTLPVLLDGGKGNDTMLGGGGDDELHGGAGNDSLDGGCGGNDKIYGEADKDTVRGGSGNDTVSGGDSDDSVDGGDGNDTVTGDAGKDIVKGGIGNDRVSGGIGDDSVEGGDGNDSIYGDDGRDTLKGGSGNDQVSGGIGDDSVEGGDGNDSIYGDDGRDTLKGGSGNDQVSGGIGDDSVDGDDGNDSIYGDAGKDTVKGGIGNDRVSGGIGDDSVEGGDGNDSIYGDDGKDTVKGGNNDDLIFGGAGNDSLYGDSGRDILIGGLDSDRLDGGSGDDILNGGTTIYDANTVALAAIFAEWTRLDLNYTTRCNNIINGGGLNGAFKLNATTVHSAPIPRDTLTGGANNDLFYLASSGDVATDRLASERLVTVHG